MTLREIFDGIVSNYFYCKYMGRCKYLYYLLTHIAPVNTGHLLSDITEYTERFKHKYTFFVTGAFIEKHPDFITRLHSQGHEIGYHSYRHISSLSRASEEFAIDILTGKKIFDSLKIPLNGYRAPHLLFDESHYFILKKMGFMYSSSKYFASHFYKAVDGLFEVPVNFIDVFDFDSKCTINKLAGKFSPGIVTLCHPYGLFARKNKEMLVDLFSSANREFITIVELLNGREGACISIDIGL